jgi:hypothetical protein
LLQNTSVSANFKLPPATPCNMIATSDQPDDVFVDIIGGKCNLRTEREGSAILVAQLPPHEAIERLRVADRLRLREVENALAIVQNVPKESFAGFRARVRHLRDVGCPAEIRSMTKAIPVYPKTSPFRHLSADDLAAAIKSSLALLSPDQRKDLSRELCAMERAARAREARNAVAVLKRRLRQNRRPEHKAVLEKSIAAEEAILAGLEASPIA